MKFIFVPDELEHDAEIEHLIAQFRKHASRGIVIAEVEFDDPLEIEPGSNMEGLTRIMTESTDIRSLLGNDVDTYDSHLGIPIPTYDDGIKIPLDLFGQSAGVLAGLTLDTSLRDRQAKEASGHSLPLIRPFVPGEDPGIDLTKFELPENLRGLDAKFAGQTISPDTIRQLFPPDRYTTGSGLDIEPPSTTTDIVIRSTGPRPTGPLWFDFPDQSKEPTDDPFVVRHVLQPQSEGWDGIDLPHAVITPPEYPDDPITEKELTWSFEKEDES